MGNNLLKISVFKKTIERCHGILATKNLDLMHIITSDDQKIFENVLHSFVGIGSVQIGMINILREIGLEPDFFMGLSFGEVATGYADGCLTEEQAILSAYYRGLVSLKGSKIVGKMALIGLAHAKVKPLIPEDIDDACHMDPNATLVAGPKESVEKFAKKMKEDNIFATFIETSNVAFHSRYIAHLGPELLKHLKELIPEPKTRSEKWFSASVLYEEWNNRKAKMCSGEYYINNLVECVYIEETSKLFPKKSIVLEIAPHCLLRKTMLNNFPDGTYIPLADKDSSDGLAVFLEALKSLSEHGVKVEWTKVQTAFGNKSCIYPL